MRIPYLLVLCILLASPCVYAVGIAGADLDLETYFVPNSQYRFDFTGVCNKQYDGLDYDVFVEGDVLKEYTKLDKESFKKVPRATYLPIGGYINFPDSLPPPLHYLKVCFLESCPGTGTICGRTGACASVKVMVPYDGIYPSLRLTANNANQNESVTFKAIVDNSGNEAIKSCYGSVDISDMRGAAIGKLDLPAAGPIGSFGSATLEADFDTTGVSPGNYSATASVVCDGITKTADTSFRIGTLDVRIKGYSKELKQGGIVRFVTTIESAWNDPLDVYGKVRIYDKDISVEGKTATTRLDPWKTLDLEAFVDTSNLKNNEYNARIEVFYAGKSSFVEGKVSVISETIAALEEKAAQPSAISATTLTIILVIVVIILTVLNIFLAVYKRKK